MINSDNNITTPTAEHLSIAEIISYSFPYFAMMLIMMTVNIFLPIFYTDQLGVSAGLLSWAFLAGRVWDAVTDPAMGHISDRTRTRWGRRRPYFLISALPIGICYYFIWSPVTSTPTGTFLHLLVCYIALFTFWTVLFIPHYSLGLEYTNDYHQRSRLFGGRQIFGLAGNMVAPFLPLFFAKFFGGTVAGYPIMGLSVGALSAGLVLLMFFILKEREDRATSARYPFFKGLKVTFRNRAFLILMFVYLIVLVGGSFIAPLCMYMARYLVKVEWVVQPLILSYMIFNLASIPVWVTLAKKLGKKKTWTIAMLWGSAGYFFILLVGEGDWLLWVLSTIVTGSGAGCTQLLGPSILADVIDSDELESGARREGAFSGVNSFIDKAAAGAAVFIGLQALAWIGYVPNVEQPQIVKTGILFLYSVLPGTFNIIGVLIFQMFPITPEVHADIRAQLEARKSGQAIAEATGS